MADLKASMILQPGDPIFGRITLPKKTAGDDIQKGDFLVSDGSGDVEKVDAVADDLTFVGISAIQSKDADGPQNILIYTQCIVECPMESDDYDFGEGLKYNAAGTLEVDVGTKTLAWAWETKGGATSLKCLIDIRALGKLFKVY